MQTTKKDTVLTGYLYNGSYGGFDFSEDCEARYNKETGHAIGKVCFSRTDPILIKYFLTYGSEWMSGYCAKIALFKVSAELLPYMSIDEYDGAETPYVNYDKARRIFMNRFLKRVPQDESKLKEAYDELKTALNELDVLRTRENASR